MRRLRRTSTRTRTRTRSKCKSRRLRYRTKRIRGGTIEHEHSTIIDENMGRSVSAPTDFQTHIFGASWGSLPTSSDLFYTNSEDSLDYRKTPLRKIAKKIKKGLESVRSKFSSY